MPKHSGHLKAADEGREEHKGFPHLITLFGRLGTWQGTRSHRRQMSCKYPGRYCEALQIGWSAVVEYFADGFRHCANDCISLCFGEAKRRSKTENIALRHGPCNNATLKKGGGHLRAGQ